MNNNKNNDDNAIVKPDTSADDAAAEAVARALSLSNSISFYLLFLISNDLHLRRVPPPRRPATVTGPITDGVTFTKVERARANRRHRRRRP